MPTLRGKRGPDVVVLIRAVTKLATNLAAMFAGSFGSPVLSVKGRCVPLAAEKETAGIYDRYDGYD